MRASAKLSFTHIDNRIECTITNVVLRELELNIQLSQFDNYSKTVQTRYDTQRSRRRWTVRLNCFLTIMVSSQVWQTKVLTGKTSSDCSCKPLPDGIGQ